MNEKNKSRYYTDQFDAIGHEISRLAIACDIDIAADGIAERILRNDDSVCRRKNAKAFEEIRHHLMALFPLEERAIKRLGPDETADILNGVRASIRKLRELGHTR